MHRNSSEVFIKLLCTDSNARIGIPSKEPTTDDILQVIFRRQKVKVLFIYKNAVVNFKYIDIYSLLKDLLYIPEFPVKLMYIANIFVDAKRLGTICHFTHSRV